MENVKLADIYRVLKGGKALSYFNRFYVAFFLPVVMFIYNLFPQKIRRVILLFANLIFFFLFSKKLVLYIIMSILSVYIAGILINKIDRKKDELLESDKDDKKTIKEKYKKKKKLVLILTIMFNISFLFYFKYLGFFAKNANLLLDLFKIDYNFKIVKHLAPIGISYYTLMAISYLVDIYNGKIQGENNLLKLSLYMTFFPQIMEGPIARYTDTSEKLYEANKITYHNLCFGYQRILFGIFKKLVVANRMNALVKVIFKSYAEYSGLSVAMGIIAYTIMLYMEFSGTMDIVIGSGEIFDVKIPENFRQPFFSKNISEFWTRWHITLGTWFKDYIFYPVSLSKPMKKLTLSARKKLGNRFGSLVSGAIALFCVWFLNGLWHGAGYTFLFFGLYHFIMILSGNLFEPTIIKICEKLKINRKNKIYRIFQSVKMTVLIFIGELFFRAPTVKQGFDMLRIVFTKFSFKAITNGEIAGLRLDGKDYIAAIFGIIIVFIVGLLKEKGINIREKIADKPIVIRWLIYYAVIIITILLAAYGKGYISVEPIYADF